MTKVAVVTGANKGIGLAIVKNLIPKFNGDVYLTSRNVTLGQESVEKLKSQGLEPKFHQLDINKEESVVKLRDHIKEKYGGIDVLINNAGIAFKVAATDPFGVQARVTVDTNYYGTKRVCDILFPILKSGARVVNMSSSCGFLGQIRGDGDKAVALRKRFAESGRTMTVDKLDSLMEDFIKHAELGDHQDYGFPNSAYNMSKIGVSALTRIQQREAKTDGIVINHVHPGYVDTDMTSHKGPLTTDEGSVSSIFAATLPADTDIKGQYIWKDCSIVDWVNGPLPSRT